MIVDSAIASTLAHGVVALIVVGIPTIRNLREWWRWKQDLFDMDWALQHLDSAEYIFNWLERDCDEAIKKEEESLRPINGRISVGPGRMIDVSELGRQPRFVYDLPEERCYVVHDPKDPFRHVKIPYYEFDRRLHCAR